MKKQAAIALFLATAMGVATAVRVHGQSSAGAIVESKTPAAPVHVLKSLVDVDGEGVFLGQVFKTDAGTALPAIRIADSPKAGIPVVLTRDQIVRLIKDAAPDFGPISWSGAEQVRISRRSKVLGEAEVRDRLTEWFQKNRVGDRGELELRLTRSWTPVAIPDDPCDLKMVDLPSNGLAPNLAIRFELANSRESLGTWQVTLQARIWREVWTAKGQLQRGQGIVEEDFVKEKRDILAQRDFVAELPKGLDRFLANEGLMPGQALTSRTLRLRPVVRRGQMVDAILVDGAMSISFKAEALEDAIPGQLIRLRNTQTKRELRGKVGDDQMVQVVL